MNDIITQKNNNVGVDSENPTTAKIVIGNVHGAALDAGAGRIISVADPLTAQDAATKSYVDAQAGEASGSQIVAHSESDNDSISISLDTITGLANFEVVPVPLDAATLIPLIESDDASVGISLDTITATVDLKANFPLPPDVPVLFHNYLTDQEDSIGISLSTITVTSPTLTDQINAMTDQQAAGLLNSVNADLSELCQTVNKLELLINNL